MVHLQNSLNLRTSQRQILTPGLVQMVSVLALNKLELKDMINAEMIENPMLEELDETVPLLDEVAGQEAAQERTASEVEVEAERVEKDPFDEIDFGSYFQDYLDPGYRTASNYEELDSPSFENFLSQPSTLTDHLMWQLGSQKVAPEVRTAAEMIVGNLNEDGYLTASVEEIAEALSENLRSAGGVKQVDGVRSGHRGGASGQLREAVGLDLAAAAETAPKFREAEAKSGWPNGMIGVAAPERMLADAAVAQALLLVQQLDPVGVGARDLRECLLAQIGHQRREAEWIKGREQESAEQETGNREHERGEEGQESVFAAAEAIVGRHLALLQRKDVKELGRAAGCAPEVAQQALDLIRALDPRPGQRFNQGETRLIEPDVAFVKRGDEYLVVMNEEDMPSLRLSQGYRKLLRKENAEKEVREYVKERYKSAIQLMRNIEQRKNTILRTCESIVRRQREFLELGVEHMKPMMIKEVAEEVGVHPSTVSRAVANKYVHTAQGVYELRFFFSEGVNGPEGGATPLMVLKRKVKKLIEGEDPRKPLTDDHLAAMLQEQGIVVTRRTVAKYREDLRIPSTHQRRIRG